MIYKEIEVWYNKKSLSVRNCGLKNNSISGQGATCFSHVILPVFCVILNQRTSSTLPSSALKTGRIPMAEVAASKMFWFVLLQGT